MNQLFFIVGDKRQDDVPYNCKPYTGKALFCDKEQGDEYYAGNDEQKSDLVLFEREILEFQCEHRDFSNQHPAGEEDEKKNDVDIERALAGVGKPMKDVVCRSSRLNFANLMAENAAIRKAT